jgi:hydrogenase nickel incorporation protein HypA/HybF
MHELSIVLSIVEIAETHTKAAKASRVDRIDLEIGELAGVAFEALDFAWEVGVNHTVLQGAARHIHRIEGKARCMDCSHIFPIRELFEPCPACGRFLNEIIQGKALRVKSLEVSGTSS